MMKQSSPLLDDNHRSIPTEHKPFWNRRPVQIFFALTVVAILVIVITLAVVLRKSSDDDNSPAPTVSTSYGLVQGVNNGSVSRYLGIPYAAAPIESLRWAPPQARESWSGVLNATQFGPGCPQITGSMAPVFYPTNQSEDCLSLNIYTPKGFTVDSAFPVMFWIHGGSFEIGSGGVVIYDGQSLVTNSGEMVVVTINYRLGVFGFLALQELIDEDPTKTTGNYGVLDQIFALEWIRDNIKSFGGDPAKITIWGESAGCNSVLTLLTSSKTNGLFRGAMCNSGAYMGVALPLDSALAQGAYILNKSGCTVDPLNCLRAQPAETLIGVFPTCTALPTIDKVVLTDYPLNLIKTSSFSQVPLLMGVNLNEGAVFTTDFYDYPNSSYESIAIPYVMSLGLNQTQAELAVSLYPLANYPNDNHTVFWALSDILSDTVFKCNTRTWLRTISLTYPEIPLHAYDFAYPDCPATELYNTTISYLAAFHAAELPYIWHAAAEIPPSVQEFAAEMQSMWSSMVMNRSPNSPSWPLYNYSAGFGVNIYLDLQMGAELSFANDTRCDFWDANPTTTSICSLP